MPNSLSVTKILMEELDKKMDFWRYLGNEKNYRNSAGVKTTGFFWICRQFFWICRQFLFWICRQKFLDLLTKFFGFVDDYFLDLSTIFFGFVDKCV